MLDLTLQNLAKFLGASYQGAVNVIPSGVAIDSRQIKEGDLFFAIKGEKVDGHSFVEKAFAGGAVGAVISDLSKIKNPQDKNLLVCEGSVRFLQDLAKLIRQNVKIPVIAVTGSTGKTTTKDMLFSILEQKYTTLKPEGNHNNELGLPLTLCALTKSHEALVVEMGMRGLGQIAFLSNIAQPTHGIITNIGQVHAELLGSVEKIAQAKAELLEYIPPNGTVFLNFSDRSLLNPWLKYSKASIKWFGLDQTANIYASNILYKEEGSRFTVNYEGEHEEIELNIPGEHNILNALSVIGIARNLGLSWEQIRQGLAFVKLTAMRLQVEKLKQGAKIINDTYNANPTSMAAAVRVLSQMSGMRKIAVLGDMYELGVYEIEGHKTIGKLAFEEKIDILVAVGELGKLIGLGAQEAGMGDNVKFFAENMEALSYLQEEIKSGDIILVKGSRGMKMETIVEGLLG
ncbi:MAG: UDP-N-acetylmuramoyl-tripeptide--D-alanyl-D-alanine ligase [Peptococcales bacterium]